MNTILLFYIYSFLGYFSEILFIFIRTGKIKNRGFLIGPYLPMYGLGAIICLNISKSFILTFVLSIIICSSLEYLTSYLLEKVFHMRWWDYSDRRFNLNGRITLLNSICFGIGSIFLKIINYYILNFLNLINYNLKIILVIILSFIMLLDFIYSVFIISKIKKKGHSKDSTDKIKEEVKKSL